MHSERLKSELLEQAETQGRLAAWAEEKGDADAAAVLREHYRQTQERLEELALDTQPTPKVFRSLGSRMLRPLRKTA